MDFKGADAGVATRELLFGFEPTEAQGVLRSTARGCFLAREKGQEEFMLLIKMI